MKEVIVELGERSYPILIGSGLLSERELIRSLIPARQVMVVTNETVGPLYSAQLCDHIKDREIREVRLPDGEAYKTLASFETLMSALLEARFERGCCIVALGGGVIGDLAGFAAACYQRGVEFVQMPTTLLAQVDSSVGGKTAVNHPLGKNMIGAFHQPRAVIADLDTLRTLPSLELSAGLAEIIKYGLIDDGEFFVWLESNLERVMAGDVEATTFAVERSCRDKARIVALDEREGGVRALLNLGHTFGHGIEHALGYGEWLHGEAVAAGMCMAARMSARLGLMSPTDARRAETLIARAGLPTSAPTGITPADMLAAMQLDKKNRGGRIRLVLMRSCGDSFLTDDYPVEVLMETLGATESPAGG